MSTTYPEPALPYPVVWCQAHLPSLVLPDPIAWDTRAIVTYRWHYVYVPSCVHPFGKRGLWLAYLFPIVRRGTDEQRKLYIKVGAPRWWVKRWQFWVTSKPVIPPDPSRFVASVRIPR